MPINASAGNLSGWIFQYSIFLYLFSVVFYVYRMCGRSKAKSQPNHGKSYSPKSRKRRSSLGSSHWRACPCLGTWASRLLGKIPLFWEVFFLAFLPACFCFFGKKHLHFFQAVCGVFFPHRSPLVFFPASKTNKQKNACTNVLFFVKNSEVKRRKTYKKVCEGSLMDHYGYCWPWQDRGYIKPTGDIQNYLEWSD